MTEEAALLHENGVTVTTARLIAGEQTFALRNISSVKLQRAGSLKWAIVWLAFAALMLAGQLAGSGLTAGGAVPVIMFGALGAGLYWRASARSIVVATNAGDQVAYTTRDAAHATRIMGALNDAIAQR